MNDVVSLGLAPWLWMPDLSMPLLLNSGPFSQEGICVPPIEESLSPDEFKRFGTIVDPKAL